MVQVCHSFIGSRVAKFLGSYVFVLRSMVDCRCMQQQDFGMSRQAHQHVVNRPDNVAADDATPDGTSTIDRQRYTMSVEDVAALLHTHGLDRDSRTIQRWCKSGKVDSVIDQRNGERWLVDPASVQPVIDDILADMSRRPAPFSPMPAAVSRSAAIHVAASSGDAQSSAGLQGDGYRDEEHVVGDTQTTSRRPDEGVATLKKRVSELEARNAQLEADVKSRESFNEYMKQQFENVLEQTLDRAERVGQLEAEVAHLQAALPESKVATSEGSNLQSQEPRNLKSWEAIPNDDVRGGV